MQYKRPRINVNGKQKLISRHVMELFLTRIIKKHFPLIDLRKIRLIKQNLLIKKLEK